MSTRIRLHGILEIYESVYDRNRKIPRRFALLNIPENHMYVLVLLIYTALFL